MAGTNSHLTQIKVDEKPTLPLSTEEYNLLLETVPRLISDQDQAKRVLALFQLMRWCGLAILDALTLQRSELKHDDKKNIYRVVTSRQKTGTNVSVPIPLAVAHEILSVTNDNAQYFFWSGIGNEDSIVKNWSKYYIAPVFKAAGLAEEGFMKAHRLRDTFAVDMLEKGVPLEEVSKMLGHESIKTTERHYAKWVKGRQDRLDSLVVATWD